MITVEDLEFDTTDFESSADFNIKKNEMVSQKLVAKTSVTTEGENVIQAEIDSSDTENMKLYKKIIYFFEIIAFFFGNKVGLVWHMYRYPLFYWTQIALMTGHASFFYTCYTHYQNGDKVKLLEPLAVVGNAITVNKNALRDSRLFERDSDQFLIAQVYNLQLKWIIHILYYDVGYSLMFAPKKLIRLNPTGIRADIIGAGLKRTIQLLKVFAVCELITFSFCIIVPLKFYLVDNIKVVLIQTKIPFVDETTQEGFIIITCIQMILGIYSSMATTVFAAVFVVNISNYAFHVDLIEQDFKDLDSMWAKSNETHAAYRYAYLANICSKFQDLNWYMQNVKKMYQVKFFIYFVISYLGQILCLYQITENDWIPGYTWALTIFIEMFFYCWVGTKLSIVDDKLFYCMQQSNWYTYDIRSQKLFIMMLHQAQQSNEIMLGPIGPLNLVTGINVVKGIYTYYTVLTELF